MSQLWIAGHSPLLMLCVDSFSWLTSFWLIGGRVAVSVRCDRHIETTSIQVSFCLYATVGLDCLRLTNESFLRTDKFFKSYSASNKLLLPVWVQFSIEALIQMGNAKSLTYFTCVVEYRPISMNSVFHFETKSKRKPYLQRELSDLGMFRLNRKI